MAEVLFISEDYVKRNSSIDENIDVKLIQPTILDVQRIKLEPVLGTKLYEGLKGRVETSTTTSDDDTLIEDYVAPALLKWVLFDLTTHLLYRYRNKNVSKKNSENSQPVDYTEYRNLLDFYQHKAEWYEERLIRYLCANDNLFPEYYDIDDENDIFPKSNAYNSSFYLGDDNYCCERVKWLGLPKD